MYPMMKVPGGNMSGVGPPSASDAVNGRSKRVSLQFPMGPGPDPMGPLPPDMGPPVMNGMNSSGEGMDVMKNSPANGPGTPREDGPPMGEYGMPGSYGENVRT